MRVVSRRGFIAAAGMVVAPAFIRNLKAEPEPIKIGFLAPLTGPFGAEAQDQVRGAQVAIDEFNKGGGFGGRQAILRVGDDKLNAGEAATRTLELIEKDKIDFLVGGLGAPVQLAINNIAKERGLVFNAIGQSDAINESKDFSTLTFHEALNPHMSAGAAARYAFANLGKRCVFLTADYAFGNECARAVTRVAQSVGAEVLADIRHPLGTTDYSPFMPRIHALKPDVLFLLNFGRDQMISAKQTADFGLRPSVHVVAPVLAFFARVAGGPDAYDGVIGSAPYYWSLEETVPSAKAFNDKFRAANNNVDPSDYGAVSYSGTRAVLEAVKAVGGTESEKVAAALRASKYDYYKGEQYYRACDHQSVQRVFILESKRDGKTPHDIFKIIGGDGPDTAMLRTCEELGFPKE